MSNSYTGSMPSLKSVDPSDLEVTQQTTQGQGTELWYHWSENKEQNTRITIDKTPCKLRIVTNPESVLTSGDLQTIISSAEADVKFRWESGERPSLTTKALSLLPGISTEASKRARKGMARESIEQAARPYFPDGNFTVIRMKRPVVNVVDPKPSTKREETHQSNWQRFVNACERTNQPFTDPGLRSVVPTSTYMPAL